MCGKVTWAKHPLLFSLQFTCSSQDLIQVKEGLEQLKYEITYASVEYFPQVQASLTEEEERKLSVVIQKLEDIDTVMKVHVNL